jgi:hypothetical protein
VTLPIEMVGQRNSSKKALSQPGRAFNGFLTSRLARPYAGLFVLEVGTLAS